ncbi:hypothetical protein KSP39_PZI011481 [Platanthera zijinensis]|uniref:Lactate/malate dehydrogenase C-terminal domain-containing protein n=1 Tax=Platanthera zijinensis TaxID=2320716 RepID=A0AAP0G5S8_9ASPA
MDDANFVEPHHPECKLMIDETHVMYQSKSFTPLIDDEELELLESEEASTAFRCCAHLCSIGEETCPLCKDTKSSDNKIVLCFITTFLEDYFLSLASAKEACQHLLYDCCYSFLIHPIAFVHCMLQVRLGKNGIEEVLGLGSLSDFEKEGLENLKTKLKASIEKGIKFAAEN